MDNSSSIKILAGPGGRIIVEGPAEALLAAGVIHPEDRLPRAPRGFTLSGGGAPYGETKISMLANGLLRVRGRTLQACRADAAFQQFMGLSLASK